MIAGNKIAVPPTMSAALVALITALPFTGMIAIHYTCTKNLNSGA
jgi:hypothetical protein